MRILAVDDEPLALETLRAALGSEHDVRCVTEGGLAIERLAREPYDVVLTDLRMPSPDGFAILDAAKRLPNAPPVIVITAVDSARTAVQALRRGASDFLIKPMDAATLRRALDRCALASGARSCPAAHGLAGVSPAIRLVQELIPRVASRREAVLIVGETGTGKELLANALHQASPRRDGPYVAHNMAATPADLMESLFFGHVRGAFSGAGADHAGLFEQADGGTLYLDEVDSFPCPLQAKLLRALETGCVRRVGTHLDQPIDVRVVASCAKDPADLVAHNLFRADLYYRLRQFEIVLPPLRERPEDLPLLMEQFLAELVADGVPTGEPSPDARRMLVRYSWPGNVRELRNAVRSAAVMADGAPMEPRHLPRMIREGCRDTGVTPPSRSLRDLELRHIREVLESVGGNQSHAARLLGIDRGTLARKLKALALPEAG